MKVLNQKVRLHDAETLEYLGEYDKERVGIIGETELVLDFRRYWTTWLIIILLIFVLFITSICMAGEWDKARKENQRLKEYIEVAEYDLNIELLAGRYATSRTAVPKDLDEVYKMCIQSGAWYPEIIMAQFIIESSSGTSRLARDARNFYGMKYIGTKGRPTLQIPNTKVNGYGVYINWQHSVLDRVLWDDWKFNKTKPKTREQYLAGLNGVYAEDPNYIPKLRVRAKEWEAKTDSLRTVMEQDSITFIQ